MQLLPLLLIIYVFIKSLITASVGLYPKHLMRGPRYYDGISPLPSLSKSENASLISSIWYSDKLIDIFN